MLKFRRANPRTDVFVESVTRNNCTANYDVTITLPKMAHRRLHLRRLAFGGSLIAWRSDFTHENGILRRIRVDAERKKNRERLFVKIEIPP